MLCTCQRIPVCQSYERVCNCVCVLSLSNLPPPVCSSGGGVLCEGSGGARTGGRRSLQVSLPPPPSSFLLLPPSPSSFLLLPPSPFFSLLLPPSPSAACCWSPACVSVCAICRKPGQGSLIKSLVAEIDKGQFEFEEYGDIHTIGSLLKKFFQELPDALIPGQYCPHSMPVMSSFHIISVLIPGQ